MPRAAARPAPIAAPSPRGAPLLVGALIGLVLVRVALELAPGAWGWGLDVARFLSPVWRWGPWLFTLVLVAPAILRRPAAGRPRPLPGAAIAAAAVVCATACVILPDLTFFTGDFALRRSAVTGITDFDRLFPQASALDRFLHAVMPRAIVSWTAFPVRTVVSAQGAVNAALFGALAVAFARRTSAAATDAAVAAAAVIGGAAMGLFTGYDKSLAELSVVTLAFAVAGTGELARGRPGWASGLLVALAIALHRSGLALVPPWALLWVWVPAPSAARAGRAWPWARIVPAALVLGLLPSVWTVSHAVDARHLAPGGPAHVLGDAFAPGRLLALANLLVFLAPLLPLLPFVIARRARDRSLTWLVLLAAPWALAMLAIHPVQGEFRDWDDFAPTAVAFSLPLAVLLARARPGPAVAAALVCAALVPRLQWLVLEHQPQRGLARIEAWAAGPPRPAPTVAASTLEFVAVSHYRDHRLEDGRRAIAAAIGNVPWERLYLGYANAEAQSGDWSRAVRAFEDAGRRFPNDATPWLMMAQAALARGDREAAVRAVAQLERLAPDEPWTKQAAEALARMTGGRR